jgi:outer membrane protein assembly factor BamD
MNAFIRRALGRAALPFAFTALIGLGACSHTAKEQDIVIEGSVEDLYNRATDLLEAENYKDAARFYNEVDRQHPYSTWASRAQLMAAYAYYKQREYDTAIAALNRFIRLHPSHRDVAYAYYLKALCNFEQIRDVKRDQTPSEDAMKAFDELIKRFPDSRYAQDARNKIVLIQDHLAGHEMTVGRWYQRHGRYLAAINRYKVVIDKYQTSRQVPEALHRMTESYTALGLTNEARRVAAVLGHNFPSSEWYFDSYELVEHRHIDRPPAPDEHRSFVRRATDWLF